MKSNNNSLKRKSANNLDNLFDLFIREKIAEGKSTSCIANYKQSYNFYRRDNGNEQLNKQTIIDWILYLQTRDISPASINHYLTDIRVFKNWLVNNNYIPDFDFKLLKYQTEQIKFYSDDELSVLLQKPKLEASFREWRTYTIICFILATGARASTVCNLQISDIDFSNLSIYYRFLKNKSNFYIPMSKSLSLILKQYIGMWERNNPTWLFTDGYENQLTVSALRQALNYYCKKRNVSAKGPHALRHTFARKYILNGGNAFTLQKLLTHSDLTMTKKYVRLFSDDLRINYENLCPLDTSLDNNVKIKKHTHV